MSVLYTRDVRETTGEYEVLCECCKKPVGWLSRAECSGLLAKKMPIVCFECDGIWDDVVPDQLMPKQHEVIVLRDEMFRSRIVIFWAVKNKALLAIRALDTMLCLSSTPYLHKKKQNIENDRS